LSKNAIKPVYTIAHVIDQLNIGGTENVLVTLCNILSRHGHSVTVVTTVTTGPLAALLDNNIKLINTGRKSKWDVGAMYRLSDTLKGFDIIHVHSSYNLRYLFVATRAFFLRKPIFFHEHFGDIEIDASVKWHHRFIYPKTIMICVSRKIYEWAANNLPIDKKRLFVLPNIVLKKEGLPAGKQRGDILELLIVSNIRPTKNLEFAIELLNALKQQQPCRLTIIGQPNDEVYYQKIISLINEYRLGDDVAILHTVSDIQPELHKYNLAIHTAKSESGPLVLIEYLAQNVPFVTYNTGETVLQIKSELPGCIASSFEVTEWVAAINQLQAANPQQLAAKLEQTYQSKFSGEAYYQQCFDIYNKGLSL
jgi:glycosyltransferase involved in cell wall biosynthesis